MVLSNPPERTVQDASIPRTGEVIHHKMKPSFESAPQRRFAFLFFGGLIQWRRHETNLSAEQHQAQTHARISGAHENPRRTRDYQRPPPARPSPSYPLSGLSGLTAVHPKRTHAQSPQSFGKDRRLSKPPQFKAVFSNATRSHAGIFSVCSRANACGGPRLGLAVSVKAAGGAVARNRLKRLIRESFRRCRASLPARDYVVVCKAKSDGKGKRARRGHGPRHPEQTRQAAADLNRLWEKEATREAAAG